MKTTMNREVTVCDSCKRVIELCGTKCDECGRDFCFECSHSKIVIYSFGVHVGGYGDAHWCKECDHRLHMDADPRHVAYEMIQKLRAEGAAWHRDYSRRCEVAEAVTRTFHEERERAEKKAGEHLRSGDTGRHAAH